MFFFMELRNLLVFLAYSADEWSQIAYVTFKDPQGADTALLLSVYYTLLSLLTYLPHIFAV